AIAGSACYACRHLNVSVPTIFGKMVRRKRRIAMTSVNPPVEFPIPADLQGFWQWDKLHGPRPMTPLTQDVWLDAVARGFSAAMNEFGGPLLLTARAVNYYFYVSIIPAELGQESIEQRSDRFQATMARVLPAIGDLWQKDWLPSILPG